MQLSNKPLGPTRHRLADRFDPPREQGTYDAYELTLRLVELREALEILNIKTSRGVGEERGYTLTDALRVADAVRAELTKLARVLDGE